MKLHQRMGVIFSTFSAFALVANVYTPDNPDHVMNIIEMSCLTLVFILSFFMPRSPGGAIQVISLVVSAFIPMGFAQSPFFGAVLAVFAMVLIYAYGGYRTFPLAKLFATSVVVFALSTLASSNFSSPGPEVYMRAFAWTVFILVFCLTLWMIVDDINKTFYSQKEAELLKINRELIAMNKMLVGGCLNEPGKR